MVQVDSRVSSDFACSFIHIGSLILCMGTFLRGLCFLTCSFFVKMLHEGHTCWTAGCHVLRSVPCTMHVTCEMRNCLLIVLSVIRHGIVSDSLDIFTGESNHRVCGD